jgi:outer membrane biosynthesis protein TonB
MSFSSTDLEQREDELKTRTTFLTYSFIGSLTLHIGLLASAIRNLLTKVPQEEPVEITFVKIPPEEIKPIQQPEEDIKPKVVDNSQIFTSTNNNSDSSPSVVLPQPQKNTVVSSQPAVTLAPKTEPLKPLPSITKESISPKKVDTQPQEVSWSKDTAIKLLSTEITAVQPSSQSSCNLSQLLVGIRDGRANQEVSEPSQASSDGGGNSVGISNSSGLPDNGGSASGSGSQVGTAPTSPKVGTNSGSGNGPAACRECNTNYPDWAKRRGVEGRVKVAVDTD